MFKQYLQQCIDHVLAECHAAGAVLEHDDNLQNGVERTFGIGGVAYGEVKEGHFPLLSLKGKATKKYLHVIITRLETGTYEVVSYIL
ncbi:MAG: hypothetical protein WCI55_08005 [Armatimonadota bacterium]